MVIVLRNVNRGISLLQTFPGSLTQPILVYFRDRSRFPSTPCSIALYNVNTLCHIGKAVASSLAHLDARDNRISGPTDAHAPHLAALGRLKSLLLMSPDGSQPNPVCACHDYRSDVFAAARSLEILDGIEATVTPGGPLSSRHDRDNKRRAFRDGNEAQAYDTSTQGTSAVAWEERAVDATSVPGKVIMPRFDAAAGRYRRRRHPANDGDDGGKDCRSAGGPAKHSEEQIGGRLGDGEDSDGSLTDLSSAWGYDDRGTEAAADDWSSDGCGGRHGRAAYNSGRPNDVALTRPEESVARFHAASKRTGSTRRTVRGKRSGERGQQRTESEGSDGGEAVGAAQGFDEEGLLGRLRSVAYEARLEVMDSRLQDLHVSACSSTCSTADTC